ncbi:MAG TPA: two-component regulator propeller domain-containing protein [Verrucomicrobiae bacterium]
MLLVSTAPANAFEQDRTLLQLVRQRWERDDGLPQNAINCIAQDLHGFIWMGTETGLVRFDGFDFEVFTEHSKIPLPHNFVSSLLVARDGTVWVGTRTGGLCRFRGEQFDTPAPEFAETEVHGIAESADGTIWVASEDGLLKWDGRRVTRYGSEAGLPNARVTAVQAMDDGTVLVGVRVGAVYRLKGDVFELVTRMGIETSDWYIKTLAYEKQKDTIWIGCEGAGLFRYRQNLVERVPLGAEEMRKEHVNALVFDASGALWIGTRLDGAYRIKQEGISRLTVSTEPSENDILSIFEDREGLIWIGTHFAGIVRLHEGRAVTVTQGLPSPNVTCVLEEGAETLWIGTRGGGLLKYSHCNFTQVPLGEDEFPKRADVRSLLKTVEGDLWVGMHDAGLIRISADGRRKFFSRADGLPSDSVSSMAEMGAEIWLGTARGGIAVYDKKTEQMRPLQGPDYLHSHIRSFAKETNGTVWIGTQNGLVRYSNGKFDQIYVPQATNMSVRTLLLDTNGTLWVGTRDEGLLRMKDGHVTRFDSRQGLVHHRIYQIVRSGTDLYLAGNQGIERVSISALEAIAEGREKKVITRLYTKRDGLATSECGEDSSPSGLLASDGTLWFGTREGLTSFPPQADRPLPAPPTVLVRKVTVDKAEYSPGAFSEVSPGARRLQIDYTALSFKNTDNVLFKHMLDGGNVKWEEEGPRDRQAVYYNLKPGKYTFRVKACNDEGVWNEAGAVLAFTVLPQFYQTGIFQAGAVLTGISLLLSGYRWRVRQIRRRNKQLQLVVNERTQALQTEVNQRTEAEQQLRLLNEELETRVESRTAEVSSAYENLQTELQQRQAAEQALARSEARLRRIVDSGMVGILFWHKDGTISDANDTFLRMVGYAREELDRGLLDWKALTPQEYRDHDLAGLAEVEKTGVCKPFEKEYFRKDGTRVPILIGAASLAGDIERGVCFVLDITKLKETEEEIRQLNLKLEARVEARTVELAHANHQLATEVQERKRVGVAVAAFSQLGQRLHSARTEREAAVIVAQTAKSLIPHDVCSIELYSSDSKLTPVLESGENGDSGDVMCSSISVSIRNGSRVVGVISLKNSRADSFNYADANTLQALGDYCGGALERIHAEEARRETERRFSTFMTNAPALAWMKDDRFRYVFTNEMFQRFTGLAPEQIVGKSDYDLWPDHVAFQMRTNDAEAVKTQSKIERHEQLKRYDGEARTLLTLRFLFTTATGEQFVAGMAVDISEQKRAEEALHRLPQSIIEAQEAERRRVARELHDGVNQAIASVKFRIQTAEQQILRSDPKWQETCSKTKEMLDSVLHQVRRLSRNLRPGELDDFGLVAAARSACQEFELHSGIQVRFTHSDFAERFSPALELSLYRIIQEALTNVEKHSSATLVEIDLTGDQTYVALEISDNGCGLDLAKMDAPRRDSGLGLLHMRERASLVGGVFSISSSPGNGMKISIHVPVTIPERVLT